MARQITVLAFDDEEKAVLKELYDSKRLSAMVKPATDQLRTGFVRLKSLSQSKTVTEGEAREGGELLHDLFQIVEQLPDSEAKETQLEVMQQTKEMFTEVLELAK